MVEITNFKKRENKKGEEFYVLVLQGEVEPVKSKQSGRMYFTRKTCTVSSTFDEETCKDLIGHSFPGRIVKVETEPYNFKIPETGEVIELNHRWEYLDNTEELVAEQVIDDALVY